MPGAELPPASQGVHALEFVVHALRVAGQVLHDGLDDTDT